MKSFCMVFASLTLLLDAYLALGSLAVKMMKSEYHHYLPLFTWRPVQETPGLALTMGVVWTSLLAFCCLWGWVDKGPDAQTDSIGNPAQPICPAGTKVN